VAIDAAPQIREVLPQYGIRPETEVCPHGAGHINKSYRVPAGIPGKEAAYLLQRLNPGVFQDGSAVMRNLARVTTHLERAAADTGIAEPERRIVRLVPTITGDPGWVAGDGAWWRLVRFIPRTRTVEQVTDPAQAREVGAAFGLFHRLVAGLPGPVLETAIPGFHDTPRRLEELEAAVRRDAAGRAGSVAREIEFVRFRAPLARLLTLATAASALPVRVVHNDAKAGNVLLDAGSGAGLAVVDLDTVMPGTILHDIGDLIRSASCPVPEDEIDLLKVRVEPSLFAALLSGFLAGSGPGFLNDAERDLLVAAGLVITYEQGIRFLRDHLAGDVYYRISRPGHNLDRARAQFRLLASLDAMRADLERTAAELARSFR
jgi:hypothetical protein